LAFKKVILVTVVTIAAASLMILSFKWFGLSNPFLAFLVNWLTVSWMAIMDPAVNLTLPAEYYDIKAFERTGQVYERLGIRLFKRLVHRGPLSVFNPTLRIPKERTVAALRHLEHQMRKAETSHLFTFLVVLLFTVYAFLRAGFVAVIWMLFFNIVINGYPVMLQRYNRIKLEKLIHKLNIYDETKSR
jgi:hypothetical protein